MLLQAVMHAYQRGSVVAALLLSIAQAARGLSCSDAVLQMVQTDIDVMSALTTFFQVCDAGFNASAPHRAEPRACSPCTVLPLAPERHCEQGVSHFVLSHRISVGCQQAERRLRVRQRLVRRRDAVTHVDQRLSHPILPLWRLGQCACLSVLDPWRAWAAL